MNVLKGKLEAFQSRIAEVLRRNSECKICVNDIIRESKMHWPDKDMNEQR